MTLPKLSNVATHPVVRWLILTISTLSVFIVGTKSWAEESNEREDVLTSEITNLQVHRDEFDKVLNDELSPQRQKIHDNFAKTVGNLNEVITKLLRDPKNAELQKTYDETMTTALTQAEERLGKYSKLRDPTQRKLTALATTLQRARKVCAEHAETHRSELTHHEK